MVVSSERQQRRRGDLVEVNVDAFIAVVAGPSLKELLQYLRFEVVAEATIPEPTLGVRLEGAETLT